MATVQLPQLTVTSAASASTVTPGDVVTVTITATNTGPVTYSGASASLGVTLTDSLADDARRRHLQRRRVVHRRARPAHHAGGRPVRPGP